jgi:glycosyltransferase involved in cell wall biosynthesis
MDYNKKSINSLRVLWLLNHTTLRIFEIPQLRRLGITEIFTPKFFSYEQGVFSASPNYFLDQCLSLSQSELEILNAQNWYEDVSEDAWLIANCYFDVAVIGFFPRQIQDVIENFKGAIVLRAFGLSKEYSYTRFFEETLGLQGVEKIKSLQSRFWFAAAYKHLYETEDDWIQKRNCYLPVGLNSIRLKNDWLGTIKRILFICPRINSSHYYEGIYQQFIQDFADFEFTIAGGQEVEVKDPRVIGFVSAEQYQENMRMHRLMFYHSTEPNHIHYHPFEAVRAGMPLIFMAGGLLDKIGGLTLWGRCNTVEEARSKVKQILADEGRLINFVRKEQVKLLENMDPNYCHSHFQKAYQKFIQGLATVQKIQSIDVPVKKIKKNAKRIAVILPVPYRGGSLRGTIVLINSLINGATSLNDEIEVILAHLDTQEYTDALFSELHPEVQRRPFVWKNLDKDEAYRAMNYAGYSGWEPTDETYLTPNDGINYFLDCDLWLIISDRLNKSLLPVRPYILMLYDYIQRYVPFLSQKIDDQLMFNVHQALSVMTTTQFTKNDVLQYMGLNTANVFKMPILVPNFELNSEEQTKIKSSSYFIWTTNLAPHKNHQNTFDGLELYYEEFNGILECHITGVESGRLLQSYPSLEKKLAFSQKLKTKVLFCRELPDAAYKQKLQSAAFLFHSAVVDNGTFSVLEAAQLGIPSLSSDYPPMREIDLRFNLGLNWMDSASAENIALNLKKMEETYLQLKENILKKNLDQFRHTHDDEIYYWEVIKSCL